MIYVTSVFSPRLIRVDVTQMTSDMSGTTDRSPLRLLPYLIWNGSIMVTYFLSRIGSAKKKPPVKEGEELLYIIYECIYAEYEYHCHNLPPPPPGPLQPVQTTRLVSVEA